MMDIHLCAYDDNERMYILGEMMFKSGLFDTSTTKDMAMKVLQSVTSTFFQSLPFCD
jgi:hypothetical protein